MTQLELQAKKIIESFKKKQSYQLKIRQNTQFVQDVARRVMLDQKVIVNFASSGLLQTKGLPMKSLPIKNVNTHRIVFVLV